MDKDTPMRKYMPTFSELTDRLVVCQLKEWKIPEHRDEYTREINDILHDIDLILEERKAGINADFIRHIIILSIINELIWANETNFRKGIREGNNLELSHGLNGIRSISKNKLMDYFGGRKDYKIDNVEAFKQWIPSGYDEK